MKKIAIFIFLTLLVFSCNKNQSAVKKLDGEWNVTKFASSENGVTTDLIGPNFAMKYKFDNCKLKDNEYCNFTTYTTVTILGISLTTNTTDLYTVKNDGTVLEVKNDSITDTWNIKELTKKNLTVEQVKGNVTNHIEATKI